MSLLKANTTNKRRVDEEIRPMEFDVCDDKSGKYEVEVIWDSTVYAKESESGNQPGLYYLVS